MSKVTTLAAAAARILAAIPFDVSIEVTDNSAAQTVTTPGRDHPIGKIDHVKLISRLSHLMSTAPDGIYLRVTVTDANWRCALVPGGAVLVGEGPTYHGDQFDLSAAVPRLTMRRISPGEWCHETSIAVYYYGDPGLFDFITKDRQFWTTDPLWVNLDMPHSSGREIDALGPRTTGTVFGIFPA